MGKVRPCLCQRRGQLLVQDAIEQGQPDRKMRSVDIARGCVDLHGIAIIATLQQQGVAPETANLFFMPWPVIDMHRKDRAKRRMRAHLRVEFGNDPVDLCFGDRNARRDAHTTKIQTPMRLRMR